MNPSLEELVRQAMELTGSDAPPLLGESAPVLGAAAMDSANDGDFYLVGLIGGKEVGKSALVNAIAGRTITPSSSHGRGTESAVAYVHGEQEKAVSALLEREVPGQLPDRDPRRRGFEAAGATGSA